MTKNGKRGCTEVSGNMMLCYREQAGQNGGRPVRGYKTRHQGADHAFRCACGADLEALLR
jgi:hypothetical protein